MPRASGTGRSRLTKRQRQIMSTAQDRTSRSARASMPQPLRRRGPPSCGCPYGASSAFQCLPPRLVVLDVDLPARKPLLERLERLALPPGPVALLAEPADKKYRAHDQRAPEQDHHPEAEAHAPAAHVAVVAVASRIRLQRTYQKARGDSRCKTARQDARHVVLPF